MPAVLLKGFSRPRTPRETAGSAYSLEEDAFRGTRRGAGGPARRIFWPGGAGRDIHKKKRAFLRKGAILLDQANDIIVRLCDVFNLGAANIHYSRERGQWHVSLPGAYPCVETGSTMRHPDGTVEKLLAAGHSLSSSGATLREAAEALARRTTGSGRGFLLSNQPFGLFCGNGDDDGPHLITVYEGERRIETFPYEKEKVRALLHRYAP
jgi:hypothetical protein